MYRSLSRKRGKSFAPGKMMFDFVVDYLRVMQPMRDLLTHLFPDTKMHQ